MKRACISVKALYEVFGETLEFCSINAEDDYFDLELAHEGIVCADGEMCLIAGEGEVIELVNESGEFELTFLLTKIEFDVATFGKQL